MRTDFTDIVPLTEASWRIFGNSSSLTTSVIPWPLWTNTPPAASDTLQRLQENLEALRRAEKRAEKLTWSLAALRTLQSHATARHPAWVPAERQARLAPFQHPVARGWRADRVPPRMPHPRARINRRKL